MGVFGHFVKNRNVKGQLAKRRPVVWVNVSEIGYFHQIIWILGLSKALFMYLVPMKVDEEPFFLYLVTKIVTFDL